MIIEFLGTLDQPYTMRICRIGWVDIARKRDTGAREYVRVSPYCSCDSQIQAAKLPRTAIPSTIDYRTSEARRGCNYKHKGDHDILSSVSVSADDSCCCRNE